MPLPFKSKPKQTYIPIGDDAIGILHFPQKWGLTPNETNLIEEATKDHKGYEKSILDFADKLLKKWKPDIEKFDFEVGKADIANAVLRSLNQLKLSEDAEKRKQQVSLDTLLEEKFEEKDSKALTATLEAIKEEADAVKNAYIQAAMVYRFDSPDWQSGWGCDVTSCTEAGWSEPLAIEIYQAMRREERGPQYDEKGKRITGGEIVSDEEFKGFTPESVKKPVEEASQKELIGAGSSG